MKYATIADSYGKIEGTTKRLEMTDYLVELLKNTPKELIDRVVYLTQGKIYPDFVGIEIGIAEKLAIKAIARATGTSEDKVAEDFRHSGDLGETAQKFLQKRSQRTFTQQELNVQKVYETLEKIAKTTGAGSIDTKMNLLAGLLTNATPNEAKYITRTVTGNLRLGIADMTVLDALAIAYGGGKETREDLERAYNISSDLGRVAKTIVENGIEGIKKFTVKIGEPIRPMLAERLGSPKEILEKLEGKCIAEYKYDGERVQAHKDGDKIALFSRRIENITDQYPDVAELFKKHVKAKRAIIEAECVAVDADTGEMRPFQELMHRRRKYGIKEAMAQYPIALFMFDLLYVDGKDLTQKPYPTRRRELERTIATTERTTTAENITTDSPEELEKFFEKAIENGCEGLVCKSITQDSVYQAGARGWLWIKYKRDYKSEMTDTVDLVVIGAFHGRGKRAGAYGALLLAAYAPKEDVFETVCKCGSGFTDEDLEKLPKILKKHEITHRHSRVKALLTADVWFEPKIVLEILGAEITLSPIHTCAMDAIRKGSGLAIRFPRFTGKYRTDKSPEDATTEKEITEMYRSQLKKVAE